MDCNSTAHETLQVQCCAAWGTPLQIQSCWHECLLLVTSCDSCAPNVRAAGLGARHSAVLHSCLIQGTLLAFARVKRQLQADRVLSCGCRCCLLPAVQSFHDRLKAEQDILETYDVEESCKYITVSNRCGPVLGGTHSAVGLLFCFPNLLKLCVSRLQR